MISFSVLAQIKMIVHLNDAESIEVYASSVDSITFTNFPVEPDDETPDDSDKPGDSEVEDSEEDEITLPVVETPGEGYTTIVLYIPESECDEAEPYILGILSADDGFGKWSNEPDRAMESLGNGWWKVTIPTLTDAATNFKFRMDDGYNGWSMEPKGSYELLENASEYLVVKDDEQNNLLAISNCDNKVLYIKSGKWSTTPCREPVPAGRAKFVLTVTGLVPEGAEIVFTGTFEENSWTESNRVMTKQADGTYVWEGDYPENFRFKAFISNAYELGLEYYELYLASDDFVVEPESGSIIRFEGCFWGLCPGDIAIETEVSEPTGYENGYGYVDLGLPSGTKWATYNVGAGSPEEYGDYFAWGEIEPKDYYYWDSYKWMTEGMSSWTGVNKYTIEDWQTDAVWYNEYGEFVGDGKTTLDLEDDAANANWGGDWRMPTKEEQDELHNNCTWTWSVKNGIKGYTVTGPNGNSIFLPAAGYRYDSDLSGAGCYGHYWSSSLSTYYSGLAYDVYFGSDIVDWGSYGRYDGQSVRAVLHE